MGFTPEQERAIAREGKVILSASAGSGKTTVMIEKIIRLITQGVGVDEILAVTFTNKAAAQMKEKLAKALIEEINKGGTSEKKTRLKRQLTLVSTADISTIHSYCAKLLRSHFFTLGIDSGFKVIGGDDADGRALKNAALDELLEEGYEEQDEDFLRLLSAYWRKKKDTRLRKIFLDTYRDLRDKADYLEFLERNTLGYTEADFERLCAELLALYQEKCRYYYELVEDEYAFFMSEVKAEKQLALCKELMEWLETYTVAPDYFTAASLPAPKFTAKSTKKEDSKEKKAHIERLAFLKERITKTQKAEFEGLSSKQEELERFLLSGKTAAALAKYLLRFDGKYEALKTERGVLDYNDLEHKALALLKNEEVAIETQNKYRYVFVDEYQDVNPVQEALLAKLAKDNLFLVGDVKQSIYGFRGSQSKFFVKKQEELAAGGGSSLYMSNNFRSADEVLDAVNAQFSLAMTKRVCDVDYAQGSYMNKGGRYATNSGKVQIYFAPKDDKKEVGERGVYSVKARAVEREKEISAAAKRIANIVQTEVEYGQLDDMQTGGKRKITYGDIAVLTRKKSGDITEEVEALSALGIPVSAASAVNVCEFSEVKALIDILSLLDNAEQDIPLCSALLSGMGNLTADELSEIRLAYRGERSFRAACKRYAREKQDGIAGKLRDFYGYYEELRMGACVLSAGEVLAKLLADCKLETGLLARKNGRACLKRIRRFLEEASAFDGSSVHEFLEHLKNLEYRIDYNENGGEDSVKVMTMHASKGLEFPVVILPNLSQGFAGGEMPEVYMDEGYGLAPRAFDSGNMLRYSTRLRRLCEAKKRQSELKDELNLYYVALTRAEQHLHLLFEERPPMTDVKYAKSFAELTDFSVWEKYIQGEDFFDVEKVSRQTLLKSVDEEKVEKILRAAAWEYPHAGYENLPVKSSPTQLLDKGEYLSTQRFQSYGKVEEQEGTGALAVDEGTAYHAFLELFDFSLLTDSAGRAIEKDALRSLIQESLQEFDGKLDCGLLREEKLVEILSNPAFYRLQGARLYKEQQFLVSLPVKDTYVFKEGAYAPETGEEEMLFQGAIDLLAVDEEGAQIIDYKYSGRSAEELKRHYAPQLNLYRLAAAKILKIPKDKIKCSIVNIRLGFEVEML